MLDGGDHGAHDGSQDDREGQVVDQSGHDGTSLPASSSRISANMVASLRESQTIPTPKLVQIPLASLRSTIPRHAWRSLVSSFSLSRSVQGPEGRSFRLRSGCNGSR